MLQAKKEAEIRKNQLDSKRKKLVSDLEERERVAASKKSTNISNKTPDEIFKIELERLMKEGNKIVDEENEKLKDSLINLRKNSASSSVSHSTSWDSSKHRIKIKWKASKDDEANGGYNIDNLTKFLNKYGEIVALVISNKKKGSAVVEFKSQDAAEMAIEYEKGILGNPLKLEWIGDAPKSKKSGATVTATDYESLVLRQLRQAEERKKLIEQMMKEEDNDE